MKSGDKFIREGVIWTLQKLPDFDLWILVGEAKDSLGNMLHCQWKSIDDTLDDPLKAFGGWVEDFKPYKEEEELVTLTTRELFKRASDNTLNKLNINIWYLNEGGDPTRINDIPKSIALDFMSEEEFNHRKHDKNS